MTTAVLESVDMAKRAEGRQVHPDDEVRLVTVMRRRDRAAFKAYCESRGLDQERVGAQWIMERLATEEAKPPPKPRTTR